MSDNNNKDTGPVAGARGVVEGVKGRAKEAFGAAVGNDELKHEGEAQQDKAERDQEESKFHRVSFLGVWQVDNR